MIKKLMDWFKTEKQRVKEEKMILYKKGDSGYMKCNTELRILKSTERKVRELAEEENNLIKEYADKGELGKCLDIFGQRQKDLEDVIKDG